MGAGPIRAAVIADTHGVLRPEVEQILETCDVIIHAGDFDNQMLYHKLEVNQPLYAVRGNNDRGWSGGLGTVKRFEIGGVKFIMAHERVDIPSKLMDAQVVIFGHSHMYYQQEINGRLWLNPGSCGYKRFTLPLSLAVMTIEDGAYEVETVWLEKSYGTPGAAQEEKSKVSRYEKQQRRYKQKAGKAEADKIQTADADGAQTADADKTRKTGTCKDAGRRDRKGKGQPDMGPEDLRPRNQADPEEERNLLFLIAKIQRMKKAGEARSWIIRNLGTEHKLAGTIYDICEKKPDANARQILELLMEQIMSV